MRKRELSKRQLRIRRWTKVLNYFVLVIVVIMFSGLFLRFGIGVEIGIYVFYFCLFLVMCIFVFYRTIVKRKGLWKLKVRLGRLKFSKRN